MEAGTVPAGSTPADPQAEREATRAAAVEAYARDHEGLTQENERDALDFLLANAPPMEHYVDVQLDTEEGLLPLRFHIRAQDGKKLDAIEIANTNESTGQVNIAEVQAQIIALACFKLEGRAGHDIGIRTEKFRTVMVPDPDSDDPTVKKAVLLASPAEALRHRFRTQWGLVQGVAVQVRRISGYDNDRVGKAQRRLVEASGNS